MTTRRGRPQKGAAHAQKVDGSEQTRERLGLILQTLTGEVSVADASEELGVSEAHFHRLRDRALQGAAEALEPRPPGRPPSEPEPSEVDELAALQQRLRDMTVELEAARIRERLALTMPHVLEPPKPSRDPGEKKKRRNERKRRRRQRIKRGHR